VREARGVIFDLDGTLIDSLPDVADAVNAGLRAVALPGRTTDEVRRFIGEGLPTLCQRAIGDTQGIDLEALVAAVTKHYRANSLNKTRLFPGIAETLDGLARRSVPIAILTNKPHGSTVPMAEALFGKWKLAAVEGYREEALKKPNPKTALAIVERMGLVPGDVLMVGDSATDMRTGVNAGLVPVGVTWGYRDRDELIAGGAKHLIDRPGKLVSLLD
jgi:phosphoglycolate phosphatase